MSAYIDRLTDDGLFTIITCLREDFTKTGDVWYAEQAERLWVELELRAERAAGRDAA